MSIISETDMKFKEEQRKEAMCKNNILMNTKVKKRKLRKPKDFKLGDDVYCSIASKLMVESFTATQIVSLSELKTFSKQLVKVIAYLEENK